MKKNLHPSLHEVIVRCACGSEYPTLSTKSDIKSTLCSKCHPFFTGEQKHVDTEGRIEKFKRKYSKK
jgi:large subunit ribosomal protein L31